MIENKIEWPKSARYVLAVSGGLDSMVLLDLLSKREYELIVAHVDHGVRDDSFKDAELVKVQAEKFGHIFELKQLNLREEFSEEIARSKRYSFFKDLQEEYSANGIITAHHKDDVLETALINLIRGTGHRGLVSIKTSEIIRPLLNLSKAELRSYAEENIIPWREDSTNLDDRYLRNHIRNNLLNEAATSKKRLSSLIEKEHSLIDEINSVKAELIDAILEEKQPLTINRYQFTMLPHQVAKELVRDIFYFVELSSKNIELITQYLKTAKKGDKYSLSSEHTLRADDKLIKLL